LSQRDPATGHLVKREFGPWMARAFDLLARLKFLRGTQLDLFGYSAERRRERADVAQYRKLVESVLAGLNEDNYGRGLELAKLSAKLRGFGHVKDRNRELLALQEKALLAQFRGEELATEVKIVDAA